MNNAVVNEALKRSVIGAVLTALATLFAVLPTNADTRAIIAAVGASFVGYMLLRGGAEGWIDTNRAANGEVIPGDVPEASQKLVVTKK